MPDLISSDLDTYRQEAGLSHGELWLRYFGLGGIRTGGELESFFLGEQDLTAYDRDLVAHAINERFMELGSGHPVAYLANLDGSGAPR